MRPLSGTPTTTSRLRRSRSRSCPILSWANSLTSASIRATLRTGTYVFNSNKGKKERVRAVLQMHANHRDETGEVFPGDVGCSWRLKAHNSPGDTLLRCFPGPSCLEAMEFPDPVILGRIKPKTKADQDRLSESLMKLAEEDPTSRVRTDEETGQTIIAGMGELHLEIIVDRLLREFKVDANVGRPQVAYREGIAKAVRRPRGVSCARPAGRGRTTTWSSTWSPTSTARDSRSTNKIVRGRGSQGVHAGCPGGNDRGHGDRRLGRAFLWRT